MLDEPFSALDYFPKEKLQLELLELLSGYEKDILMVTHSRDEIYRFCDDMIILENGKKAGGGETKAVFKDPKTIAAAKLTGCKNIEPIVRKNEHEMYLPGWDVTIHVKGLIPDNATHIGIRAHYLRICEENRKENVVACNGGRILEDPFELVVVFDRNIWWKISREEWKGFQRKTLPERLYIPEESILYLTE